MKILHINTWDSGGAANAAKRIYRAQKTSGLYSSFLALKPKGRKESEISYYDDFLIKKYGKLISKLILFLNKAYNQLPVKFNRQVFFNRPESLLKVHNHPLVTEADIIHFHATVKFIDIPTFFQNINKPIVWTLHDMNPFKGGMHYTSMMNDKLIDLEKRFIQVKKRAVLNKNIHIVSPSKWLKELSEVSEVLSGFPHSRIPNCIDTESFNINNELHKSQDPIILFVAENVNDPRKGFKYFLEALDYLDDDIQINVLGNIALNSDLSKHKNLKFLGYISSTAELAKIYSAASVYVISSIEDNLPNTIVESHICGTPVVGFKTSGIENMIDHKVNGILVDNKSGKTLAKGILDALEMKKEGKMLPENISLNARNYYSEQKVIGEYNKVYKKALS